MLKPFWSLSLRNVSLTGTSRRRLCDLLLIVLNVMAKIRKRKPFFGYFLTCLNRIYTSADRTVVCINLTNVSGLVSSAHTVKLRTASVGCCRHPGGQRSWIWKGETTQVAFWYRSVQMNSSVLMSDADGLNQTALRTSNLETFDWCPNSDENKFVKVRVPNTGDHTTNLFW